MDGGLPTSLRINQPTGRGLTYSPYSTSVLEEIMGGVGTLAGVAEQIRQRRRQQEIVESIIGGKGMPERKEPEKAKSTVGRILQVIGAPFDIRRPPTGMIPLEETIAEAMIKEKITPSEWKPRTKEERFELERVKEEAAGKLEELQYKHELSVALENRKHQNKMEIIALEQRRDTAKTDAEIKLINERIKKMEKEGKLMDLDIRGQEEAVESMKKGFSIPQIINNLLRKRGIAPEEGIQRTLPGVEEPPAEGLIPTWLPPDVQERLRRLKEAGATDEEIQTVIDSYRR